MDKMDNVKVLKRDKTDDIVDMLKKPAPGSIRQSKIETWFRANPEAMELIDTWLRLRRTGETNWGCHSIAMELRGKYGFPFRSRTGLLEWVKNYRPDDYVAAIQRLES